ncbi:hypothetical protein [Pseudovibrio denitrificans]|nr:hypothetical protein [Pseudovibrio denitrificans]
MSNSLILLCLLEALLIKFCHLHTKPRDLANLLLHFGTLFHQGCE